MTSQPRAAVPADSRHAALRASTAIALATFLACTGTPSLTQGDGQPYEDPHRPVCRLDRTEATLQWFTQTPSDSRVQLRLGTVPANTPGPTGKPADVWRRPDVRVVEGPTGKRTYHRVTLKGLKPGTRYSYRLYDPGATPTGLERTWGAEAPWRREYSFSTLAPKGRKTVIRVPIKVLLMPNVVNVASAHDATGALTPPPPLMTKAEIDRIRQEYRESERFLFINNGMRVWFDYQIFVDERRQRWGEEPGSVGEAYRGWPASRSWAGVDFTGPGGGEFTIVDTRSPHRAQSAPVHGEREVYAGQIEQAFPRRWNPTRKAWEFYNSGGGTYGMDEWPRGVPGRSQYLGGGDTAWLATHEYHHQIESIGTFSLANREDDRVVFDHFAPRRRVKHEDGSYDEWTWTTSWKHGEHWDGIALFDRMLTPVQWLRLHWGETTTVVDADEDGVPDDDPRLPFDEKRFGSDPRKRSTDGRVSDFDKVQMSTWAPYAPLTASWNKTPQPRIRPNPRSADSDGDGIPDSVDPYPLYPWEPFIWPVTARVDGSDAEWRDVPMAGQVEAHGVRLTFKQAHDDAAYYAVFRLTGPWSRAWVALDGEGQGYYTTDSTYAFEIVPGGPGEPPTVRSTSGNGCPGMAWKASADGGAAVVEVEIPNRGESLWYWTGGGREVGAAIHLTTTDSKPISVYEPYNMFFARMLERAGRAALPPDAPAELQPGPGVLERDLASAGAEAGWTYMPGNWELRDGAFRFVEGEDGENHLYLEGFDATDLDVWVEFEAANDMHIGAWSPSAKRTDNVTDYVAFLGGFGNARSVIRAFGQEAGSEDSGIEPGRHTMQLTRRGGQLWLLYDGKPLAWGRDPRPELRVDRIGFLGGWGGAQRIHRVRIRAGRPAGGP